MNLTSPPFTFTQGPDGTLYIVDARGVRIGRYSDVEADPEAAISPSPERKTRHTPQGQRREGRS